MKKIKVFIIALFLTTLSWGQNLVEDFDYATGTTLVGNNGWSIITNSGSTNAFTVNNNILSYLNSPSNGIGFGLNMTTSGQRVGKFLTAIKTGSTYMSFFVNVSTAGKVSTLGSNFAGIMTGPLPSPGAGARVFTRAVSGGGFNFGVGKTAIKPIASINYESTVRALNTTYLVVLKYTFNSATNTDDIVDMWVNPLLGAAEPTPYLSIGAGINDVTGGLTGPHFIQRDVASPTCQIDAVRYGSTWAFVTIIKK